MPLVYILLLNYGKVPLTLECLDSLAKLDYPNYRVIVIDNASPDDSLVQLNDRLARHPDTFELIASPTNLGFSGGNNLAIQKILENTPKDVPVFVWLLNNDTTVAPDSLTALVEEAMHTGGVTGSLILNPDGSYQQSGTRFNWWTGGVKGYPESRVKDGMPVESLIGASMLVPLKAIRQVGLMDESFFLYFEDGEWSVRLARGGYSLTVCTKSKIYHRESATTGKASPFTQYYYHRNRLRFMFRYASWLQKLCIGYYASYRLLRFRLQAGWSQSPRALEKKRAAEICQLALQDFGKGISGPCPHPLQTLN